VKRTVRHLVSIADLSSQQIAALFRLASRLKRMQRKPVRWLEGKVLGLLFHKPSVRTRVSFEVGMAQLGGESLYMGPVELEKGKRESPQDVARVLSRYLDALVVRTFDHRVVEEMAQVSSIPVINGLSDFTHPCQALADLFTLQEILGRLKRVRLAYVGDGNNVCHALMQASARMGVWLKIATPPTHRPDDTSFKEVQEWAYRSGGRVEWTEDPEEAVKEAEAVYTDVWTSMGHEKERSQRQRIFRSYQVNRSLMRKAAKGALFMHCLPAHRGEEVTDEVIDSPASIVYDQAENRLHVQKAILLDLLGGFKAKA